MTAKKRLTVQTNQLKCVALKKFNCVGWLTTDIVGRIVFLKLLDGFFFVFIENITFPKNPEQSSEKNLFYHFSTHIFYDSMIDVISHYYRIEWSAFQISGA